MQKIPILLIKYIFHLTNVALYKKCLITKIIINRYQRIVNDIMTNLQWNYNEILYIYIYIHLYDLHLIVKINFYRAQYNQSNLRRTIIIENSMSQVIKQTNHEFIQHDISNFHKIASITPSFT